MKSTQKMELNQCLVLNSYIFSLFGVKDLEELTQSFKGDVRNEDISEDGISEFYHSIVSQHKFDTKLDPIELLKYDSNIVRHTKSLKQNIKWKYFQYLTLLFTEIYLDRYFSSKETLLNNLNDYLAEFNSEHNFLEKDKIQPFELEGLNKLAFWNATGSGKTLLMHINIKQFKHYNKGKINKAILITPNEGLTQQHLKEFASNGIMASIFQEKDAGLFDGENVEILEISKLKEEQGETTFAVDSFGDDNLVFIDEGHRGSSGEEWKTNRDTLSKNGFAFEYSATFGQSIGSASGKKKKELTQEYAKAILFDYSYKYFKDDGFGKDYNIINLEKEPEEGLKYNYLVGSLLTFYQQKKIFVDNPTKLQEYNIENPLMVFVGGSVSKSLSKEDGSDISQLLKFLKKFVTQKELSIEAIAKVKDYHSGININSNGIDIFANKFAYLSSQDIDANYIYNDMLKSIFNSLGGGRLILEELKGNDGEIGLKVGESEYFGVINIGDTSKFLKLCESLGLDIATTDFSQSLFLNINDEKSKINVLIGSKKFTEGWSSWRVSTMGLLNMGKKQGSQVIQLFGRGVRLKGKDMSLKRSSFYGKTLDAKLTNCERLNIFGLQANYMAEFREYLDKEGVESVPFQEFTLPLLHDTKYKDKNLKILILQEGKKYKDNNYLDFKYSNGLSAKVVENLYAKAQVIGIKFDENVSIKANEVTFDINQLGFLDMNKILLDLIRYKNEKKFYNLNITKEALTDFVNNQDWYTLEAPEGYFSIVKFKDFDKIQEVFTALLKKYMVVFYKQHKNNYEKDFFEYQELSEANSNFIDNEYNVSVDSQATDLIEKIKQLQKDLEANKKPKNIDIGSFTSFYSNQHLTNPLLSKDAKQTSLKITPIELNQGEMDFVKDLDKYLTSNAGQYKDSEIFLLRNKSKVGIGFFDDGGFYPDFILWILKGDKQYITFIDPKGIRNLNPKTDKKFELAKTIKEKEKSLGDTNIILNSFIISNTHYKNMKNLHSDINKAELEDKNILFQEDTNSKTHYIAQMINKVTAI